MSASATNVLAASVPTLDANAYRIKDQDSLRATLYDLDMRIIEIMASRSKFSDGQTDALKRARSYLNGVRFDLESEEKLNIEIVNKGIHHIICRVNDPSTPLLRWRAWYIHGKYSWDIDAIFTQLQEGVHPNVLFSNRDRGIYLPSHFSFPLSDSLRKLFRQTVEVRMSLLPLYRVIMDSCSYSDDGKDEGDIDNKRIRVLNKLLAYGADPNICDHGQPVSLIAAFYFEQRNMIWAPKILPILVAAGMNINFRVLRETRPKDLIGTFLSLICARFSRKHHPITALLIKVVVYVGAEVTPDARKNAEKSGCLEILRRAEQVRKAAIGDKIYFDQEGRKRVLNKLNLPMQPVLSHVVLDYLEGPSLLVKMNYEECMKLDATYGEGVVNRIARAVALRFRIHH